MLTLRGSCRIHTTYDTTFIALVKAGSSAHSASCQARQARRASELDFLLPRKYGVFPRTANLGSLQQRWAFLASDASPPGPAPRSLRSRFAPPETQGCAARDAPGSTIILLPSAIHYMVLHSALACHRHNLHLHATCKRFS